MSLRIVVLAAAEVAETYPSKKVMLVQSNKQLVPGYSPRMSRQILKILQRLKVEVKLYHKVHVAKHVGLPDASMCICSNQAEWTWLGA